MPSDDRVQRALAAVAPQIAAFRSVVASTLEHARAVLSLDEGADHARLELGALGSRIDPIRFAALASGGNGLDPVGRDRVSRAAESLRVLMDAPDESFVVELRLGDSLEVAVRDALARFGRVFGLANSIDLARRGGYVPRVHDRALDAWPVELWTQRDRKTIPPIVATLSGADLDVGRLADVLDGNAHLVLVVTGDAAPARLVRLITPRTLVLQTTSFEWLPSFTAYAGLAIAAFLQSEATCFVHDPDAGRALWQRIAISSRPSASPRKRIGAQSPAQQLDELRQLEALAERPSLSTAPIESLAPAGGSDPTERLATWLLNESGVSLDELGSDPNSRSRNGVRPHEGNDAARGN